MEQKEKELLDKATELLDRCGDVTIATIDSNGFPRPVPMAKMGASGCNEIWMSTGADSIKTIEIKNNPKTGVCYSSNGDSVALRGIAEIVTDDKMREKMWVDWMKYHFTGGPTDPNYVLIRFVGKDATIWINHEFARIDLQ